jgi:hypothetical protein
MILAGPLQLGLGLLILSTAKIEDTHIHPGILTGGIDQESKTEVPLSFLILPESSQDRAEIGQNLHIFGVGLLRYAEVLECGGMGPHTIEEASKFAPSKVIVGIEA